jgi:histidine ammonia-lyase
VQALQRLAALEALLAAQAMDIHGDEPGGAVKLIYDAVRRHAAFYTVDRPLSAEVEAIEAELASDAFLTELIAISPIHAIDGFFALGGFGMQGVQPTQA